MHSHQGHQRQHGRPRHKERPGRPQTPVQQRQFRPQQSPATPATPGPSPSWDGGVRTPQARGQFSPEVETFCPQPLRALPLSAQTIFMPGSPSWSGTEEAASHELRELLGSGADSGTGRDPRHHFLDSGKALEPRPLSSVSTCAGPTPSPDDRGHHFDGRLVGASTPDNANPGAGRGGAFGSGGSKAPARMMGPAGPTQTRKVFVGGIPQEMGQNELFCLFNEIAAVKKAWLQKYRASPAGGGKPHNHRGFGFVIFHDEDAVEQLLGSDFSRFLVLSDGKKLEVKRALSSNDMSSPPNPSGKGSHGYQPSQVPGTWHGTQGQCFGNRSPGQLGVQAPMPPSQGMMVAPMPWISDASVPRLPQTQPGVYSMMQDMRSAQLGAITINSTPTPARVMLPSDHNPQVQPGVVVGGMVQDRPMPLVAPILSSGMPMQSRLPGPEAQCAQPHPALMLAAGGKAQQRGLPARPQWGATVPAAGGNMGLAHWPGQAVGMAHATLPADSGEAVAMAAGMAAPAPRAMTPPDARQHHAQGPYKNDVATMLMQAMPDHYDD